MEHSAPGPITLSVHEAVSGPRLAMRTKPRRGRCSRVMLKCATRSRPSVRPSAS